jgi:hypothetical protein
MAALGWNDLSGLGKASIFMKGSGAISNMFAAGAKANYQKYVAKSQALDFEHKADMALFNMDQKERQAQWLSQTFAKQFQILTMKQGNQKSKENVSLASRGGVRGVGSSKDVALSSQINRELDKMTMNSNKVRAISNKRLEKAGLAIQADRYKLSASNSSSTASSISTFSAMSSSLLTGASSIVSDLPSGFFMKKA